MRLIIILNTSTIDALVTAWKDERFSPNGEIGRRIRLKI